MALSNRIFVVETAEDQAAVFMGVLGEQQDTGVVLDWGCVVPVSLADDEVEAIADDDEEAVSDGT